MTPAAVSPDRLSFNQITADRWSLPEVVEACAAHGIPAIAPWRHKVAQTGLEASAKAIADAGLRVSSLCRGGYFPAATDAGRRRADEDNRRAVEEAAALGAEVLVLVCGPAPGRDLAEGRAMIERGIDRLLPHAAEHGVRLGVEPLHPMTIGERSALVTLGHANAVVERLDAEHLGVVIDVYHVFWDDRLESEIERARGRIFGFHVCDWRRSTTHTLLERGMMGDGIIDIPHIRGRVEAAGFDGLIEVEIINPAVWDLPRDTLLERVRDRFSRCV
jgi:sugar phosphate isomerase/epimerase